MLTLAQHILHGLDGIAPVALRGLHCGDITAWLALLFLASQSILPLKNTLFGATLVNINASPTLRFWLGHTAGGFPPKKPPDGHEV